MPSQSEKNTQLQTKIVKVYTLFQTKTAQKPYRVVYKEYPLPPQGGGGWMGGYITCTSLKT